MYKKFLNLLILVFISSQAYAYGGGKIYTFDADKALDSDELVMIYDSLKVSYDANNVDLEKMNECSLVGKYYMPNHPDKDTRDCYDIKAYLDSVGPKVTTPVFVGETAISVQGDIGYDTSSYKNTHVGKGALLGDTLCKNQYGSKARAARAYDMRYLSDQKASIAGYVFEPEIIDGVLHKSTTIGAADDCSGYTSTVGNWDKVEHNGSTSSTCSTTTTIMCVQE